jgi:hypothetical protein
MDNLMTAEWRAFAADRLPIPGSSVIKGLRFCIAPFSLQITETVGETQGNFSNSRMIHLSLFANISTTFLRLSTLCFAY